MSAINLSTTSLPPSAKKLKISRSSFAAPLKVVVGPNAEEFFINEELICAQSKFFKADDPTLFAIFLSWLATGDIESCSEFLEGAAPPHSEVKLIEQTYAQWEQLRRFYNLGNFLLAPSFKNAAVNLLIETSKSLLMSHNMFPCRTVQELETVY
ncbi:hypothetical protein BKA61DRAFT_692965 [Leptodontidium sp. MPI-SDFR-AT-0119]|nr:hypothetical protein BKA61DRAFT_692965 [Leptodontidium sp. MPI-SDFR-AT-0119]